MKCRTKNKTEEYEQVKFFKHFVYKFSIQIRFQCCVRSRKDLYSLDRIFKNYAECPKYK